MFAIYSHDKTDPESDLIYVCSCESKSTADYVVKALEYFESGGKDRTIGMYNHYIKSL